MVQDFNWLTREFGLYHPVNVRVEEGHEKHSIKIHLCSLSWVGGVGQN